MKTTTETITPEIAKRYLEKKAPQQRPVRKSWVARLAESMKNGTFHSTHQGIAFDTNGNLFDGQHRMMAVIQTGIPLITQVTRDVEMNAWHGTDIGRKRTYSDITALPKNICEPIRYAIQLTQGLSYISSEEMIRIAELPIGQNLKTLTEFAPSCLKYFSGAPFKLLAAAWMTQEESDYPKEQYRALVLQHYDSMSSVSKAICRQASTHLLKGTDHHGLTARAFIVFNPKNKDLSKIQISSQASSMQQVRMLLDPLLLF